MTSRILSAISVTALLSAPAVAQDTHTQGVTIFTGTAPVALFVDGTTNLSNNTCIGNQCDTTETYSDGTLEIKMTRPLINFNDVSSFGNPDNDWRIRINDFTAGGLNAFFIDDITGGTTPFTILAGAPQNAMVMDGNGNLGLNTAFPLTSLHVSDPQNPTLRLEQTGMGGGFLPYAWNIQANNFGFAVQDGTSGFDPLVVEAGAPTGALTLKQNGFVGLGTNTPDGAFHSVAPGLSVNYFESASNAPVQVRFRSNSENRRFLATNSADEVKSQIIFRDDEIVFAGATTTGENLWLTVGPGGAITSGPSCTDDAPCDRTFDPDVFVVPPIEERAAFMWENHYLKGVGPTKPDMPYNLTEKSAGMLHELEIAHIYIEQLNTEINALQQNQASRDAMYDAQIAALTARLDMLETNQ